MKQQFIPSDKSRRKFADMNEPTGFPNLTDSTITWSDSTPDRTFTISPTSDNFSFYQKGKRYTKTNETIQIDNLEGLHIIYYNKSLVR